MRQAARVIGRRLLRNIERRVHQHARRGSRCQARGGEIGGGCLDIETHRAHAIGKIVAFRIAGRERGQGRIDFHQRDGDARDPARQRQARAADTGAEIDRMVAGLRDGRRREQDGVVADAMAAQRLTQHQPAAEDRILARLAVLRGHRGGVRCRTRLQ